MAILTWESDDHTRTRCYKNCLIISFWVCASKYSLSTGVWCRCGPLNVLWSREKPRTLGPHPSEYICFTSARSLLNWMRRNLMWLYWHSLCSVAPSVWLNHSEHEEQSTFNLLDGWMMFLYRITLWFGINKNALPGPQSPHQIRKCMHC